MQGLEHNLLADRRSLDGNDRTAIQHHVKESHRQALDPVHEVVAILIEGRSTSLDGPITIGAAGPRPVKSAEIPAALNPPPKERAVSATIREEFNDSDEEFMEDVQVVKDVHWDL